MVLRSHIASFLGIRGRTRDVLPKCEHSERDCNICTVRFVNELKGEAKKKGAAEA